MKLSIITITYNNAEGLCRTIQSVQSQTFRDFEHIIVDGGSTDGSVDLIREYADSAHIMRWISEPDNGVYDAQNKGIRIAQGEYCYFLNAGDTLCANDRLEKMMMHAGEDIVYGNEIIVDGKGKQVGIARGVENPSFVDLYNSCMKHQASFIRRSLFDKYGMYDADMRICSDFDWFFRVIAFHDDVTLQYKDVDIAYFENTGISHHNPELCVKERQQILNRYMSKRMQWDYALLGRYSRLSKVGDNKFVRLLLKVSNRLLK